mmetsp:Transcript_106394/g.318008  ORF Transcript_106394/g.318008 Transcript_106394/m.318008 type:complete len:201 (-) Transcript_106394:105-707(-)
MRGGHGALYSRLQQEDRNAKERALQHHDGRRSQPARCTQEAPESQEEPQEQGSEEACCQASRQDLLPGSRWHGGCDPLEDRVDNWQHLKRHVGLAEAESGEDTDGNLRCGTSKDPHGDSTGGRRSFKAWRFEAKRAECNGVDARQEDRKHRGGELGQGSPAPAGLQSRERRGVQPALGPDGEPRAWRVVRLIRATAVWFP